MNIRRIVTGAVLAGAIAATAACGGNDNSDAPPVPSATTSSAAATSSAATGTEAEMTNPNKVPGVAALNDMLQKALDPNIKPAAKTDLVEGSEVDPNLFTQLVKAKKENPDVTYEIKKPILKAGPNRAKVKVEVKLPNNPPTKIDASIVFDNGRWKLSKETVCPLLSQTDVQSPLCVSPSSKAKSATSSKKAAG
ncbi:MULTISPECIES: hypothetical protein [Gordonia]|uniref:Low molecular weight antigen MTB12-like C-terminal domain-containing protein n=2 Tax=Gordonia TaxID=2053 RepID=L7LIW7_9ACTN|nr:MULTISPECIES: hypothetical protein [Gordonia]AUH68781.1 hypothetical protein CXX93_10940 [Gordonia sp. YC-JH1]KJR09257.1 hypothetical protein UG54_05185 [Gordonia sihwensis]KXT58077.1 hypothetical protein Y710_05745 [Gordonia sp. QH-12]MBY4571383.1 hypothetical protein [Gordonia sihwensis]WFN91353.1 hypothetical protein P5P27_11195 [Gordonia sihwensis]